LITYLTAGAYLDAEGATRDGRRSCIVEPFTGATIVDSLTGLFDPSDALTLIRENACSGFNIKISKAGGIRSAQLSALFAQTAGMKCQVGCFSESRLGITALAHFSLAHEAVVNFDMDSPFMLSEDPINGGIYYTAEKQVVVGEEIGIGCTPDITAACFQEI
jgi:L-alanine-DL-glutamate epimerase-like enolase superfamily enzyme